MRAAPQDAASGGRWVDDAHDEDDEDDAPVGAPAGRSLRNLGLVAVLALVVVGSSAFLTLHSVTARTEQPAAPIETEALRVATPPSASTGGKTSYDRAAADQSLPEAPQTNEAYVTSISPIATPAATLSPAPPVATRPVVAPLVAASPVAAPLVEALPDAGPAAPAIEPAPVPDLAQPAVPAPDAGRSAPGSGAVAALTPPAVKRPAPTAAAGTAKIVSAVTLRAGPDNKAAAVSSLQGGMTVVVLRCKGWCEIVAGGKHGYVFQKFLALGKRGATNTATPTDLF